MPSKRYIRISSRLAISFAVFAAIAVFELWSRGSHLSSWFALFGALTLMLGSLYFLRTFRNGQIIPNRTANHLPVRIADATIAYPKGYFFRCSPLHKTKQLTAAEVIQINLHTWPPSLVLKRQEIVFVRYDQKEELRSFGLRNQIDIVNRFDIWEHLCAPYLDTETSPAAEEATMQRLIKNGLNREEIRAIRQRIKWPMYANNFVWEWVYLGQYHYLSWVWWLRKKQYWWSMDIALRNLSLGGK